MYFSQVWQEEFEQVMCYVCWYTYNKCEGFAQARLNDISLLLLVVSF